MQAAYPAFALVERAPRPPIKPVRGARWLKRRPQAMPLSETKGHAMEDGTTEHLEHAEHAEHAAHSGDPFLTRVSVTIAILAVVAATVGSLETIESGAAISDKNELVLLQNKAADTWAFFQAQSVKKNLYDIASASNPAKADEYDKKARRYGTDSDETKTKAEDFEKERDAKLEDSNIHEHRHHVLTIGVTLLHVSIAVATIAIIMRGQRWPWYASVVLGIIGAAVATYAYA